MDAAPPLPEASAGVGPRATPPVMSAEASRALYQAYVQQANAGGAPGPSASGDAQQIVRKVELQRHAAQHAQEHAQRQRMQLDLAAQHPGAAVAAAPLAPAAVPVGRSFYSNLDLRVSAEDDEETRALKARARNLEERLWSLRVSRSSAERLYDAMLHVRDARGRGSPGPYSMEEAKRLLEVSSSSDEEEPAEEERGLSMDPAATLTDWEIALMGADGAALHDGCASSEEMGALLDRRTRRLRAFAHEQAKRAAAAKGVPLRTAKPGLAILRLGRIHRSAHFANAKYLLPVGYAALREYASTVHPHTRVRYTCSIVAKPQRTEARSVARARVSERDDRINLADEAAAAADAAAAVDAAAAAAAAGTATAAIAAGGEAGVALPLPLAIAPIPAAIAAALMPSAAALEAPPPALQTARATSPAAAPAAAPAAEIKPLVSKDSVPGAATLAAAAAALLPVQSAEELAAMEVANGPLVPWFVVRNDAEGIYICEVSASAAWARIATLAAALQHGAPPSHGGAVVGTVPAAGPAAADEAAGADAALPAGPKAASSRNAPSGPEMFGYSREDVGALLDGLPGVLDLADPDVVAVPYVFRALRCTEAQVVSLRRQRDRLALRMRAARDAGTLSSAAERETKRRMKVLLRQRQQSEKTVAKRRQQRWKEVHKLGLHTAPAVKRKRVADLAEKAAKAAKRTAASNAKTAQLQAERAVSREENGRRKKEAREEKIRLKEEGRLQREGVRLEALHQLRVAKAFREKLERACRVRWREEQGRARTRLQRELTCSLPAHELAERPLIADILLQPSAADNAAAGAATSAATGAATGAAADGAAGAPTLTSSPVAVSGADRADAIEVWSFLQAFAKELGLAPPPRVFVQAPVSANASVCDKKALSSSSRQRRSTAKKSAAPGSNANPNVVNSAIAASAELAQRSIATVPSRLMAFEDFCAALAQGAPRAGWAPSLKEGGEISLRLSRLHRRLIALLLSPRVAGDLTGLQGKVATEPLKLAGALLNPLTWPEVCRQVLRAALARHEQRVRSARGAGAELGADANGDELVADVFRSALCLPARRRPIAQLVEREAAAGNPWLPEHIAAELEREEAVIANAAAAEEEANAVPDVLFRLTGVMLRCHAIIRQLRLHPFAPPFLEPVDPAEWAGYLDKVTTPMDLGTIEKRLLAGVYGGVEFEGESAKARKGNPKAFVADCKLVWRNCQAYNDRSSEIYQWASRLAAEFESLYNSQSGWLPSSSAGGSSTRPVVQIDTLIDQTALRQGDKGSATILVPGAPKQKSGWRKSIAWLAIDVWDPMNTAVKPLPRSAFQKARTEAAPAKGRRSGRGRMTHAAAADAEAAAAANAANEAVALVGNVPTAEDTGVKERGAHPVDTDAESTDEEAAAGVASVVAATRALALARDDSAQTHPAFARCVSSASLDASDAPPRAQHPRSQRRYNAGAVFAGAGLRSPVLFGYIAAADGAADGAALSVHAGDAADESQSTTVKLFGAAAASGALNSAYAKQLRAYARMLGDREYSSFSVAERLGLLRLIVEIVLESPFFRTAIDARIERQDSVRKSLKAMVALYQERERLRMAQEKDAVATAASAAADVAAAERAATKNARAAAAANASALAAAAAVEAAKGGEAGAAASQAQSPHHPPVADTSMNDAVAVATAASFANAAARSAVARSLPTPPPLPVGLPPALDDGLLAFPFRAYDEDAKNSVVVLELGRLPAGATGRGGVPPGWSFRYEKPGEGGVRRGLWLTGYSALRVLECSTAAPGPGAGGGVGRASRLEVAKALMKVEPAVAADAAEGAVEAESKMEVESVASAKLAKVKSKKKQNSKRGRRPAKSISNDAAHASSSLRLTFLLEVEGGGADDPAPRFRITCVDLELAVEDAMHIPGRRPKIAALRASAKRNAKRRDPLYDAVPQATRRAKWWSSSCTKAVRALAARMEEVVPGLHLPVSLLAPGPELFGAVNMHVQTAAARLLAVRTAGVAAAAANQKRELQAQGAYAGDIVAVAQSMVGALGDRGAGSPHLWMPWRHGKISPRAGAVASVRRHPAMIGHTLVTPPLSGANQPVFVYKRRLHKKKKKASSATSSRLPSGSPAAAAAAAEAAEEDGEEETEEAPKGIVPGKGVSMLRRANAIVSLDCVNPIFLGSPCIVTPSVALPCAFCGCPASMTLAKERSPMMMVTSALFESVGSTCADARTTTSIGALATGSVVGDPATQAAVLLAARASTKRGVAALASTAAEVPARRAALKASLSVAMLRKSASDLVGRLVHKECSDMISRELGAWQRDARLRNAEVERLELEDRHAAHHCVELSMTRPQLLGRNRFGSAFWLMGGDASHIFVERASDRQWECISRWTQIAPLTAALNTCGVLEGDLLRKLTALLPLTRQSMFACPPRRQDEGGVLPRATAWSPTLKIVAAARKAGIIAAPSAAPAPRVDGTSASASALTITPVDEASPPLAKAPARSTMDTLRSMLLAIESSIAWGVIEERVGAVCTANGWSMPRRWRVALGGESAREGALAPSTSAAAAAANSTAASGELAPWFAFAVAAKAGAHEALRAAWKRRVADAGSPTELVLAQLELEARIPALFLAPRLQALLLPVPNAAKIEARLARARARSFAAPQRTAGGAAVAVAEPFGARDRHGPLVWSAARVAMRLYALELALVEGPLFTRPRSVKRRVGRKGKRGR